MNSDEAKAIYERVDVLAEKIDRLAAINAGQQATCRAMCTMLERTHSAVYGNGDGLIRKVERLETARKIGGKGFWALVACLSAVVSGAILAAGGALLAWMKG